MLFTPFHMGPGIFIKVLLQGSFSLVIFGWAQLLMDIQPLVVLLTDNGQLHGFSHTYIGASLIAVLATISGKYLADYVFRFLSIYRKETPLITTWAVTFSSSFIGTFSHVILDSVMHGDMKPFYPLPFQNKILEIISLNQLHLFCIFSGIIGAVLYYISQLFYQKNSKRNNS